ncbi:MAG TPA: acetyl-CoA carboxylase biotin carboxyl carrier protein [Candidatus Ozemobacteraceae bacterium]|nr:acetyl-CoA carboxylase biotin carboxyl carrier protein [Candidatus Ozemobacteraceae bacterium]
MIMAKDRKHQDKDSKPSPTSPDPAVFDQVTGIIRLMGETGLAELDLETPDMKIALRRQITPHAIPGNSNSGNIAQNLLVSAGAQSPVQQLPVSSSVHTPQVAAVNPPVKSAAVEPAWHKIASPMAGTFYRSPSPSAPLYVKIGDEIKAGQPICIVEAMKLMNEIKADKAGKIVHILVENGKSVEKGTPLFHIDIGV